MDGPFRCLLIGAMHGNGGTAAPTPPPTRAVLHAPITREETPL